MKSVLIKLREAMPSMSSTETIIAKYIQENPNQVCNMTIRELAEKTYASPSSIVRVCRVIGFEGYKDFRENLSIELATLGYELTHEETEVTPDDSMEKIMQKITRNNIHSLEDTLRLQNPEVLKQCVDLLHNSRNILLFGIGSSFCVAKDTHLKFLRLNKYCVINEDPHSQILQARNSSPEDVAIIFSYSGQTKEMISCINILNENRTPCIAITRFATSPISKLADYRLYTAANETLFRSGAMSSRLSQLNVIDILYTAFAIRKNEDTVKQLLRTHIQKE